ncbi:hypothetical protein [Streptomyces ossamyceticus]|uniref:YCII-related domain-containing protein n=1 Tax=Streptomyces ossamyceticus TaxID=249581 RepID=A0ABV2V9C6_9ACTN
MPQPLPGRPDFFTRQRALLEQAVAATVARGRGTPCPQSSGTSAYGEGAAPEKALLTGGVIVSRSDAGTDFHGSAVDPAAATLSDPAFVTGRLATPRSRRPVPFEESAHV